MADASFALARLEDVPAGDDWLGPRERKAMDRFAVARRRAEWRAGRWAAKRAVGQVAMFDPAQIEILSAPDGAPEVWAAEGRMAVNVSISHRAGYAAALAVPAGLTPGCDLELVEPRPCGFAADWFTASERSAVEGAPAHERDLLITLIWSAKEAVLKVLRQGLRLDTRQVEISVADGTFQATVGEASIFGWWRRDGRLVITAATRRESDEGERDDSRGRHRSGGRWKDGLHDVCGNRGPTTRRRRAPMVRRRRLAVNHMVRIPRAGP